MLVCVRFVAFVVNVCVRELLYVVVLVCFVTLFCDMLGFVLYVF